MKPLNLITIWCIIFSSALILQSCKSSVEGETSSWDSNSKKNVTLKQQYPQFTTAIDQQFEIARQQWVDAQAISNEEQKISAMSTANRTISSSFIDILSNMESQKRKLRDTQEKLRRLNGSQEVSYRASSSTSECITTLSMIDMTLVRGAQSSNEAESMLQMLKQSTENTLSHANEVIDYADELERNKEKEAEKNAKTSSTSNSNTPANANETTPESGSSNTVNCSYCGSANLSGGGKCSSCKAPL